MSTTKQQEKKDAQEPEAGRFLHVLFDDDMLDKRMAATGQPRLSLTGLGGFLPEMIKAVLERGMVAEMSGRPGMTRATGPITAPR